MPRLTLAAAEQKLRATSRNVYVRRHALKDATAQVDIANCPHLVLIDPVRGAPLDCLVHELIHVAWLNELEAWGAFEEVVVEALEDAIVRYINRSAARVAWWRKRLAALLEDDGQA